MTDEIKVEEGQEGQEPTPIEGGTDAPADKCPHCVLRDEEESASNEMNLAILIALVPALTITLFSNMGIF